MEKRTRFWSHYVSGNYDLMAPPNSLVSQPGDHRSPPPELARSGELAQQSVNGELRENLESGDCVLPMHSQSVPSM